MGLKSVVLMSPSAIFLFRQKLEDLLKNSWDPSAYICDPSAISIEAIQILF